MTDLRTLSILEYDVVLKILSDFAVSELTKREIINLMPSFDVLEAERLQTLTDEAYITLEKYRLSPVIQFDDITEILSKAKIGVTLQMGDLLKVARLIRGARISKKEIVGTGGDIVELKKIVSIMFVDAELENEITTSIAGDNEMKDEASDKLRDIRRKIKNTDAKLKDKLSSYTRSNQASKYLQDNLVTVREGRFVLPVKSECRSFVPGLIHDRSATGSTVFIEPYPIVELNNEIKSLKLEEAFEIERILQVLSAMVSNVADRLEICQNISVMLDIIYAKNAFSIKFNCSRPKLNTSGFVNLIAARHPLIDKNAVVPVDICFGREFKLLLITGPNTGGKTVCLKTVGLFCLMAYLGIKIPCAEGSELSVFDNIFCDIGDEQSIQSSLSTFSSHIKNIIGITQRLTNKSLVLFDELGGGTDPVEGAALAVGIIKFLELSGARGILTTHYGELKEYALTSKNIKNGCMQFDEETLKPTYKLIIGIPGISNALKIAKSLGLNEFILTEAKKSLDEEKVMFELVLQNAEKAKSEAIAEKDAAEKIKLKLEAERAKIMKDSALLEEKIEKINANAQLETRRIINKNVERAESLIEEMKELLNLSDERALHEMHRLKKDLSDIQYLNAKTGFEHSYEDLEPSDIVLKNKVVIKSIGSVGEIASLPNSKNELDVISGNVKFKLKVSDLAKLSISKKPLKKEVAAALPDAAASVLEIKVLGLTVNEAVEIIIPHIMSGIGRNVELKIIHGKGTGALGRGLQDFLKRESYIDSVRYGGYNEGGTGVTFAKIK